jgi:RNA polymerase sigma factor (sigma-70 family)
MIDVPENQAGKVVAAYHFCRIQLPGVALPLETAARHFVRTYTIYQEKTGADAAWEVYFANWHPVDWFLACACLERDEAAWERLFAARAHRKDNLLIDAIRARAARLYPRNDERQESAVSEFWSQLLVSERDGARPILARYDGLRPLVPWLIRVFQNAHITQLRPRNRHHPLLDDDDFEIPATESSSVTSFWLEAFRDAAKNCLGQLSDHEMLILGLRFRYHLSQREVAQQLGVHEGTISRQTEKLRDRCLESIAQALQTQGWTGDGLGEFVRQEMVSVLLDDPRLSAEQLAKRLSERNRKN